MKLTWLGHACFLIALMYTGVAGRPTPFFAATAILTITPQTVWSCCQSGKARLRTGR